MKTYTLPLSATKSFSQLVNDYLSQNPFFTPYGGSTWSETQWEQAFEQKRTFFSPSKRALLIDVIRSQYEALGISIAEDTLTRLSDENTFTVCCAHQPNLLGGPMYTVIKIASTIALCRQLQSRFPSKNFIPVYYIGSEDHDVQELNHLYINNEKIEWSVESKGAFGSLGCKESQAQVNEVLTKLSFLPFYKELESILHKAYQESNSIAQASFVLMQALFADSELLCIDANNAQLKESFIRILEKEIFEETSHATLSESIQHWESHYPKAVEFRQINVFYLDAMRRTRIVRVADHFETADASQRWTADELKNLISTDPAKFSPNAVLRPVYQEWILPNIAFVGGGSEVAYWKQVYPIFEKFKVPYPSVHLRNSLAIIDNKFEKRKEQLAYEWADWFESEESLIQQLVDKSGIEWRRETDLLQNFTAALESKSAAIDKGLEGATGAAIAQINKAMEGLEKKWTQAIKRKEEDHINAIKKGKQGLQPNGILQERRESFLPFLAKYGLSILPTIITAFEQTDSSKFLLLNLEADV